LVTSERKPVADPVEGHHVLALAGEPAAVDHLGLPPQDGLEQLGPVGGVVFEVGVLDQDQVAADGLEAGADGRTLSLVVRMVDHPDRRVAQCLQHLVGTVGRPVVDDDHLDVDRQVDRSGCDGSPPPRWIAR
jgi:hypothetical protein